MSSVKKLSFLKNLQRLLIAGKWERLGNGKGKK